MCPSQRVKSAPPAPPRNLHEKIELTLLTQSPAACRAAYLLYPCYEAQLSFRAPYAVSSASTDYAIHGFASCPAGGRPETGWALERDVKARETVNTTSLGLFTLTPRCLAHEGFEVRYGSTFGAGSQGGPYSEAIVGTVSLSEAASLHNG
jgi:hypothetical protein